MTLTIDTAIMMEVILVVSILSIILIGRLMWRSGGEFIPPGMKQIYRQTMEWLEKAGWGQDTGAKRDEYPNRREDS